ncbi:ABC-three component system middle component 1 [Pseudomonas aeruginosa]|uniref:ABC-three component system middle component 1 n=1 Tax=Pseudomonas aeruginosa TaxID=287 RepID=UPI0018C744F6|nr:ABC-three component system middle component 1 [Pseudomonas aeruginosa]MBG4574001.1 hypothetical protein [Pseudomonas aeruginosa]MDM1421283.1 hypothetical protein [Pseudomonas aeruginosa]MDM1429050.1 hypothetical protein [Pseudomonas aeruginosa]MDM1440186.1 hypothetical protein [Pseudomonas aeruginosa]
MINIINNILSSNGYKQVDMETSLDNDSIYLFCPSERSKREEYFVTIQLQTQSDAAAQKILEEKAQELFEAISNSGKVDRPFEKNCTMLICHEEEGISRQTILALEEDQYNFKKNVITYTPGDLATLKAHLSEGGIKKITNDAINEIINSEGGRNFLAFKGNHPNSKGYYSLTLKTALKLPFITYSPQEQQLTNLSSEIENSLSPHQSSIYSQLMESEAEWTDDNIHHQVAKIWGGLA